MTRIYHILIVFSLFSMLTASAVAQNAEIVDPVIAPCHTYLMQEALFEANPELKIEAEAARLKLEDFTRAFALSPRQKDGDPIIIPVVFHIIHNNGTENISDEQVRDCIRVLTEDFNAGNPELASVNPTFQGIIGNVGVEFRLAQLDPDGNCTNGIVREESILTNSGGENLKIVSPIWDRQSYMNVWVCRTIASGAAGYTFNPFSMSGASGDETDGIVVRSDYVGAIGTSNPGRSHTMSHEVGHWVNLAHTWGPTNEPGVETNCEIDDFVLDTPNTMGAFGCNVNGMSCGVQENVENYMDYSSCSKMFTTGQAERMLASFNLEVSFRSSLWTPQNLIETGVAGPGILCLADFKSTSFPVICAGASLTFEDLSYNGITTYQWTFEGGEPSASSDPAPVVFWNTPGDYSVTLTVGNAAGTIGIAKTDYVRVLETSEFTASFTEGWEGYTSLQSEEHNWTVIPPLAGENSWELYTGPAFSGSQNVVRVRGRLNSNNILSDLISPTFDLSGVSPNAVLQFRYAYTRRNSESADVLRVLASSNCGDTWSVRRTISGNSLPTISNNVTGQYIPLSQDDWELEEIDNLSGTFLQESVLIRFEFKSFNGQNIYIDDINLFDPATVGLEEISFLNQLFIFPNPATSETNLTFATERSADLRISMIDLTGRQLKTFYSGTVPSGKHTQNLNVSGFASGMYLIRIESGGEQVTRRFLINSQ